MKCNKLSTGNRVTCKKSANLPTAQANASSLPPKSYDQHVAIWHYIMVQRAVREERTTYIRAQRVAFERPPRWEPWMDDRIPAVRFVELFRMSLADFSWLAEELHKYLAQDPLGQGQPLSVEAQVGVGLYRLAHGSSFVTIAHVFSIGKETADKASDRFVNALITVFRFQAVK